MKGIKGVKVKNNNETLIKMNVTGEIAAAESGLVSKSMTVPASKDNSAYWRSSQNDTLNRSFLENSQMGSNRKKSKFRVMDTE